MERKNEMHDLLNLMSEYHGQEISDARKAMFALDLKGFTPKEIMAAWAAYRIKNTKFPMPKDLLEHIQDGRPSAQEAWGLIPRDEDSSVVWSDEMRLAYGACASLIAEGQTTNAFFVFKERYEEFVKNNRKNHIPPKWSPSFGRDVISRQGALTEAVEKGRLPVSIFERYPELAPPPKGMPPQLDHSVRLALEGKKLE